MAFGDKKPPKKLNRALRVNAKDQLQKALGGGLVSDRETQVFEDQSRAAADSGIKAQQVAINQAQAAAADGSVVEGQLAGASSRAQEASADAAVNASAKAQAYTEAAETTRRQEAITNAENQRQEDARRRQVATKYGLDFLNTAGTQALSLLNGA